MPTIAPPADLSFVAILPTLCISVFALLLLLVEPLSARRITLSVWLALIGIMATLIVCVVLGASGYSEVAFSHGVILDGFAYFFDIASLAGAAIAVLLSIQYLEREEIARGEYYALLLFTVAGMLLLTSASDLVVFFLALEALSLSLYVLAGYNRTRLSSEEAGMKYFLLGAFSFGFLLYGVALVYGATGATSYTGISAALHRTPDLVNGALMRVGVALIVVGFGFKLAFVPFHMWTPDVYEGAPTPITAFMSVGTKVAVFGALVRMVDFAFPDMAAVWVVVISALTVLTILMGNIIALAQTNIKRLLAYSSIAQAGYVLVAVVAGANGTASVMFYLLGYTAMNLGAFAVVIALGQRGEPNLDIREFSGLGYRQPWLAAALTLFMLSLAGVPPTVGFFGKFYLFSAAVEAGRTDLAIVGVIGTAISVYYYLRLVVLMYMRQPEQAAAGVSATIPFPVQFSLVVTAVATIVLGIIPTGLVYLAQQAIAAAP